jgi:hypothetical protein
MMSMLNQSLLTNGLAPRSTARSEHTHQISSAALTGANFIHGGATMSRKEADEKGVMEKSCETCKHAKPLMHKDQRIEKNVVRCYVDLEHDGFSIVVTARGHCAFFEAR